MPGNRGLALAGIGLAGQRGAHRGQQQVVVERLFQKIHGADLHRLHRQ